MRRLTHEEWLEEGKRRFGKDWKQWKFVCPSCKTVQSAQDFIDRGVKVEDVSKYLGYSCVGRFGKGDMGCDYTLGGLLRLHTTEILMGADGDEPEARRPVFEFAEETEQVKK